MPLRLPSLLLALVCTALLAGCSGTAVLNAVTPAAGVSRQAGLAYGAHPRQQLDVYLPDAPLAGAHPVVLFFYGGSWNRGERAQYRFVGEVLAGAGIVTAIADYRLYPEVRYPEFLDDSAAALAYVHRHLGEWGGDAGRLFVVGHSAGAYNAAMLALDPRWLGGQGLTPGILAGWAGLAGPYDFIPVVNPEVRPVFHHPDTPPESQPIHHAAGGSPDAFLAAAREDPLVNPRRNAVQLAERLAARGTPVRLRLYDRVGHATLVGALAWPLRWMAPVRDDLVNFIRGTGGG